MKFVEQSVEILEGFDGEAALWRIEEACRNCYKSEGKNSEHDPRKRDSLVRHVVGRKHTSVLEHVSVPLRVICDRGVSHEWVRHRIGWSYSQESTRYCNYGHSEGITVIWPTHKLGPLPTTKEEFDALYSKDRGAEIWLRAMSMMEAGYLELLSIGWRPEDARDPLGIALKTEIVATANLVALRHFFNKRCPKDAHPKIRALALQLLADLNKRIPIVFEDLALDFLKG